MITHSHVSEKPEDNKKKKKKKKSPTVPYLVGDYNKLVNKFMLQEQDQKQSHLREGVALPMPYP